MIDHDEVIEYIREEIRPKLKKAQIEKMMDHLYASQYVANTGNWEEVIDIILSRPDVYPLQDMTQDQFYSAFNFKLKKNQQTKHQRLIKDLREKGFSWEEIMVIFRLMTTSPWAKDWAIETA
jgi:hypothetical protein